MGACVGGTTMNVTRKHLLHAAVIFLSSTILGGASRCTDCGPGTYYSETTRKCEARLGAGVEIDANTGAIVAQLSDEAIASLQTSVMGLQSRIETLETASANHATDIAANSDALLNLPDFAGWDTNVADDFDGSYASLSGAPDALLSMVNDLSSYVSVDTVNHSIVMSGVNLQVVDGSASTVCSGSCNGLGNVVVGYDEGSTANKSGSHNLVVGSNHTYISYGGFIAGRNNSLEAEFGSVSGGQGNVVSAECASISGGVDNSATGDSASVSGGSLNAAISNYAWIGGGESNRATANYSAVSGGRLNEASGQFATVGGGRDNEAAAQYSSVTGGLENSTANWYEMVP